MYKTNEFFFFWIIFTTPDIINILRLRLCVNVQRLTELLLFLKSILMDPRIIKAIVYLVGASKALSEKDTKRWLSDFKNPQRDIDEL